MKCFRTEKTNMSSMPSASILSKKDGLEEFKRQINRLYNKESEKDFKDIAVAICDKLEDEHFGDKWTNKEYGEFKKIFLKVGLNDMKYISSSIKKCLESSNKEVLEELKKFSNITNWYPIKTRKNIKESNGYTYIDKDIEVSDCFYIINNLMLYIYRYIYRYAEVIINMSESIYNINITKDIIKKFLDDLDEKFNYVKEYPLFCDVYNKMKEDSINILKNDIVNITRKIARDENYSKRYSKEYSNKTTNLRHLSKVYRGVRDERRNN